MLIAGKLLLPISSSHAYKAGLQCHEELALPMGLHALSAQCVCNLLPCQHWDLSIEETELQISRPRSRRERFRCSLSPGCGSDECAASDGLMRHSAPSASGSAAGGGCPTILTFITRRSRHRSSCAWCFSRVDHGAGSGCICSLTERGKACAAPCSFERYFWIKVMMTCS